MSAAMIFSLSACAKQTILNVDTFIERLCESGMTQLKKESFISYEESGKRIYFTLLESACLTVTVTESTDVESVSLTSEKQPDESFISLSKRISEAACGDINAGETTQQLFIKAQKSETARESSITRDFAITLFKGDFGCKFTVSFNEVKPYETTSIPETMNNSYQIIEEPTAPN